MQTKTWKDELEVETINYQVQNSNLITAPKKITSGIRWGGIGAIILCGICCSLPLLGGGVAVAGAVLVAFVKVAWVWVVIPIVIIGALLLTRRNQNNTGSCSSGQLTHSCSKQGDGSTTDSSCGCGK